MYKTIQNSTQLKYVQQSTTIAQPCTQLYKIYTSFTKKSTKVFNTQNNFGKINKKTQKTSHNSLQLYKTLHNSTQGKLIKRYKILQHFKNTYTQLYNSFQNCNFLKMNTHLPNVTQLYKTSQSIIMYETLQHVATHNKIYKIHENKTNTTYKTLHNFTKLSKLSKLHTIAHNCPTPLHNLYTTSQRLHNTSHNFLNS